MLRCSTVPICADVCCALCCAFHLQGCFFTYSYSNLMTCLAISAVLGWIGVSVAYHRCACTPTKPLHSTALRRSDRKCVAEHVLLNMQPLTHHSFHAASTVACMRTFCGRSCCCPPGRAGIKHAHTVLLQLYRCNCTAVLSCRLLTHRSFKTYKIVEYMLTILAVMTDQGAPIVWVSNHR